MKKKNTLAVQQGVGDGAAGGLDYCLITNKKFSTCSSNSNSLAQLKCDL